MYNLSFPIIEQYDVNIGVGTAAILLLFFFVVTAKTMGRWLSRRWRILRYKKRKMSKSNNNNDSSHAHHHSYIVEPPTSLEVVSAATINNIVDANNVNLLNPCETTATGGRLSLPATASGDHHVCNRSVQTSENLRIMNDGQQPERLSPIGEIEAV
jgi:hypothetical protein